MASLKQNFDSVRDRIERACARADKKSQDVKLVAVSKYRPLEQTRTIYDLSQIHFGESRVQEVRDKVPQMPTDIEWHLIGPLQANKAKYLPGVVSWIHSVEREKTANAVEKAFSAAEKKVKVFAQINVAGEDQKQGVTSSEAAKLVQHIAENCPHLDLQGLMTMAPKADSPEDVRWVFAGLRELRDQLQSETGISLPELSMGMTSDFEVAIEEGATVVRVGTALYTLP